MNLQSKGRKSGAGRQDKPAGELVGHVVPRVFTPPLHPLEPRSPETERWTYGYDVIDFAEQVLHEELLEWQKWLYIHALECNEDGSFRFKTIAILVARQNGKTTWARILIAWFLFVFEVPMVLGTSQDLDTAEEVWNGVVAYCDPEDEESLESLRGDVKKVWRVNGKKALQLKGNRRYKTKAATKGAGRGLTGDLIFLDELREQRNWDAWAAITKTTMARPESLIITCSNAGDAGSVVLHQLRKAAHERLGDPDGICSTAPVAVLETEAPDMVFTPKGREMAGAVPDFDSTLGIFEWSALPNMNKWDRQGWAMANPSLPHLVTEGSLQAAAETDPDEVFRQECMCQWETGSLDGPFPPGAWKAGTDPDSEIPQGNPVWYCLDIESDRSRAFVGVCGLRADGDPHVELAAAFDPDRAVRWFNDRADTENPLQVVVQERGAPASSFIDVLEAIGGVEVIRWGGVELGIGCGRFYDAVRRNDPNLGEDIKDSQGRAVSRPVWHRPQPALDLVAATAVTKPAGDAWFWDRRKSPQGGAPLMAVTGAFWAATRPVENKFESAYEDSELLII